MDKNLLMQHGRPGSNPKRTLVVKKNTNGQKFLMLNNKPIPLTRVDLPKLEPAPSKLITPKPVTKSAIADNLIKNINILKGTDLQKFNIQNNSIQLNVKQLSGSKHSYKLVPLLKSTKQPNFGDFSIEIPLVGGEKQQTKANETLLEKIGHESKETTAAEELLLINKHLMDEKQSYNKTISRLEKRLETILDQNTSYINQIESLSNTLLIERSRERKVSIDKYTQTRIFVNSRYCQTEEIPPTHDVLPQDPPPSLKLYTNRRKRQPYIKKEIEVTETEVTSLENYEVTSNPVDTNNEIQTSLESAENPLETHETNTSPVVTPEEPHYVDEALLNNTDFADNLLKEIDDNIISNVNMGFGPVAPVVQQPPPVQQLYGKDTWKLVLLACWNTCGVRDEHGDYPIHTVVLNNDLHGVKRQCSVLKLRKLHVDILNADGHTALHLALMNNADVAIVRELIRAGASLAKRDSLGDNVYHIAVKHCMMTALQKNGLLHEVNAINDFNYDGLTPLMVAAMKGKTNEASILIDMHAQLDLQDKKSGRTALFHAVESSSATIVERLLEKGASKDIRNYLGVSVLEAITELDGVLPTVVYMLSQMEPTAMLQMEMKVNAIRKRGAKKMLTTSKRVKVDNAKS